MAGQVQWCPFKVGLVYLVVSLLWLDKCMGFLFLCIDIRESIVIMASSYTKN